MKKTVFAAVMMTALGLGAAAPAMAYEAGDWLVRGRVININPNDDSGQLYLSAGGSDYVAGGKGVEVDSDTVPELDITYMMTKNWGLELILGYSEHTVKGEKNWNALGDVIDSKVLPPTLTLQYHFLPDNNIRPYVGAGINYTYFFDEEVAGNVLDVPGAKVELDSSWGLALQAGVDVALNQDWFVNFDVKYIDIDTEAHFSDVIAPNSGIKARINADIDPIVWGIGIGRRF